MNTKPTKKRPYTPLGRRIRRWHIGARSFLFICLFYAASAWVPIRAYISVRLAERQGKGQEEIQHILLDYICYWSELIRNMLWRVMRIKVEVRGEEYLPDHPCIFAANHQTLYDGIFLTALLRSYNPVTLAKVELTAMPLLGHLGRLCGVIFVDRDGGEEERNRIAAEASKRFREGRSLLIFPEGTTVMAGQERPFKKGVSWLYQDTRAPVVPIAINTGLFWHDHTNYLYEGTMVFQILPTIGPAMKREVFLKHLETTINDAALALMNEAHAPIPERRKRKWLRRQKTGDDPTTPPPENTSKPKNWPPTDSD